MNPGEHTVRLHDGTEVSHYSEAWRHECECRWLLANKPTRTQKHMYLYGVADRAQLFTFDSKTGRRVLRDDLRSLWPSDPATRRTINPLMHYRGLEGADRLLDGARKIYELQNQAA